MVGLSLITLLKDLCSRPGRVDHPVAYRWDDQDVPVDEHFVPYNGVSPIAEELSASCFCRVGSVPEHLQHAPYPCFSLHSTPAEERSATPRLVPLTCDR